MKLRTHTCRAAGCQHVISLGLLMCMDHWRMVPAPLRREVVDLNRQRLAGERGLITRYRDAVDRAVAAVKQKQERKAQDGPSGSLFNA